jgi:hypothetical protein
MNEFNYWDIPLAALPSRGKEYPESATIKFRCLNVRDLKFLAAINEKNSRAMVNSILERCLLIENLEFKDILEGDRLTLVFYLRTNTFQLSNNYQTEFVCPYCRSRVSSEFKMSSLHVKNIDESVLRSIYIGGVKISGVHRKISDKKSCKEFFEGIDSSHSAYAYEVIGEFVFVHVGHYVSHKDKIFVIPEKIGEIENADP